MTKYNWDCVKQGFKNGLNEDHSRKKNLSAWELFFDFGEDDGYFINPLVLDRMVGNWEKKEYKNVFKHSAIYVDWLIDNISDSKEEIKKKTFLHYVSEKTKKRLLDSEKINTEEIEKICELQKQIVDLEMKVEEKLEAVIEEIKKL